MITIGENDNQNYEEGNKKYSTLWVTLFLPAHWVGSSPLVRFEGGLDSLPLRVQEKITCCFIALSFRSDLVDLIEQDRRRSLSYSEDTASEERPKLA
ncbi:MAG: hypothetical protein D8M57_07525 [Candidatus Scalindua sp. AMX11]|nr:MAG: hypothetical protein DWQ00_05775 [Candidatus Scalindua sp.]TDE65559.1 MAG: hypothetical protein D8M57_07525 [Candidatus Scalindua sp. AMX11]